jgi:hypothetical protein
MINRAEKRKEKSWKKGRNKDGQLIVFSFY